MTKKKRMISNKKIWLETLKLCHNQISKRWSNNLPGLEGDGSAVGKHPGVLCPESKKELLWNNWGQEHQVLGKHTVCASCPPSTSHQYGIFHITMQCKNNKDDNWGSGQMAQRLRGEERWFIYLLLLQRTWVHSPAPARNWQPPVTTQTHTHKWIKYFLKNIFNTSHLDFWLHNIIPRTKGCEKNTKNTLKIFVCFWSYALILHLFWNIGIKVRALFMLGRRSAVELQPQATDVMLYVIM